MAGAADGRAVPSRNFTTLRRNIESDDGVEPLGALLIATGGDPVCVARDFDLAFSKSFFAIRSVPQQQIVDGWRSLEEAALNLFGSGDTRNRL